MQVQMVPLGAITPYDNNPRHNDAAVEAVAASIRAYGWRVPLVCDEAMVIIAGHTRYKAAVKLGLTEVPVHVAVGLSPEQARAYRIADNATATLSTWDDERLTKELLALQSAGFDVELTGLTADELMGLLQPDATAGLTDPDDIPEPPDEAVTKPGDLWLLGEHRLLCGDSAKAEDVDRLLGGHSVQLVNTDPPYNVRVEPRSNNAIAAGLSSFEATHHQKLDVTRHPAKAKPTTRKLRAKDRPLANDFVSEEEFDRLLRAWFGHIARALEPGRAAYVWGGYANCANYPAALKACGLYFSQAVIWVKEHPVLTRKDFMGNHEWCQPGDTRVETPEGPVPLSSLRDGDRVIGYSRKHHAAIGVREGLPVRHTSRPYSGPLLGVSVGARTTWCTPGHHWSVKLAPSAADRWCVYLMRRGAWWRVGKSKLLSTWGFGVKHRLKTEGGEDAWVLSVHPSNLEAAISEQVVLAEYGIPTTTWAETAKSRRTIADVASLYGRLDLAKMRENALRLLADHGRCVDHPFLSADRSRPKVGRRTSAVARACNLLPGVMMVPVPVGGQRVAWGPVRAIDRQPFEGSVYSMGVERFQHYIADGLVTHNCFYCWREGAAHQFFGPANATDVWSVKKVPSQQTEHITQKPVELASRAIQYSSRPGERVLDLFGGSGSTLIACEQLGRKALLMELDPLYGDVIIDRWQRFTGRHATLAGSGRHFPKEPPARPEAMR